MRHIIVILLVLALLGCEGSAKLTDAEYLASAQGYLDKGELRSAATELKNALSVNPKNPQARWLLSQINFDLGDFPGAEKELLRAKELGVKDESVLPLLAKAYLQQTLYKKVWDIDIPDGMPNRAAASILTSRALARLGEDKPEKAQQVINDALRNAPDLPYALYGQASLDFKQKKYTQSRQTLERIFKIDPAYSPAWSLLGDVEKLENNPQASEEAYTRAIETTENQILDVLKRALVRIQMKAYDSAQEDIDWLLKRLPKAPGVNYAQGLLHYDLKNYEKARESFEKALSGNSGHMKAVYYLGATQFALKNSEQAKHHLSRFLASHPDFLPARKLMAALELADRDHTRAEELIRPVVAADPEDTWSLNILSNALMAQGKTQQGQDLLQRAAELQPDSAQAKRRLGLGQMMQGEFDTGVKNLETAIELDPQDEQTDLMLVMSLIQRRKFEEALEAANSAAKRRPENPKAHNMVGLALLWLERTEQANDAFDKALSLSPGDPTASFYKASIALSNAKPDEAREVYKKVLESNDNHLPTLLRLAALEEKQNRPEELVAVLNTAISAHPEAIDPRVLLAQFYLRRDNIEGARKAIGEHWENANNTPVLMAQIGQIQLAEGDYRAAKISFQQLVQSRENSAMAHFLLSKAHGGLGDEVGVERELARTLQLDPLHFMARVAQTRLFITADKIKPAQQNLTKLKILAPENPDVLALEAAMQEKAGKQQTALDILAKRFRDHPHAETVLGLSRFKWRLGEQKAAIEELEKWTADHPEDLNVRIVLANFYLEQQRLEQAVSQYEKVLEQNSEHLLALNNLAWNLRKSNPERALQLANRALDLAPESEAVMDTLSELLLLKGDLNQAERMNQRSLQKQPENPSFQYRRAKILDAMGDPDEARRWLESVLKSQQTFSEQAEAIAMQQRLGG